MSIKAVRFLALSFAALALVPAGAHLAELPNKIGLPKDEYLIVQQIYRGWALFGIVVGGALASTLALTIMSRHRTPRAFRLVMLALISLIGTQVIFWWFAFPTNQVTENWTVLPSNWIELRRQWEYSHAGAAVLNIVAFVSLALALPDYRETDPRQRRPSREAGRSQWEGADRARTLGAWDCVAIRRQRYSGCPHPPYSRPSRPGIPSRPSMKGGSRPGPHDSLDRVTLDRAHVRL